MHYSFIGYMIAIAIILIICVIGYRLLLEKAVRPSANRLIMLSIYFISFIIPLLSAVVPLSGYGTGIEIGQPELAGIVGNTPVKQEGKAMDFTRIFNLVAIIYFLGLFLFLLFSLMTTLHLFILLRKSREMEISGVKIYVHKNKKLSSFSWCNKIFLFEDSINSEANSLIMLISHEKAHLDKGHWLDLALAQIVLIFQWFNPAAWFMRSELQRIHEYEADDTVLKSGIDEKEYQMLLIQNISGNRYSGLTDGLNNCSLKKRIIMMKKKKFKKDWGPRAFAICAFAVLGGLIIHIPAVAQILETTSQTTKFNSKMIKINGEGKGQVAGKDVEYYIDGQKIPQERLASVDPDYIKEMKIDKFSATPKVEVKTKKAPEIEDIGNIDFNEFKKKGVIENYPDAYGVTDKMAEYIGGQSQLLRDLSETIVYPEEAQKQHIEGRVVVRFQINTNGTLSNCEVAYSQNPMLDEAALKAVESLPGKWEPAELDGKPVASVFNLPVTFKLQ